MHLSELDYSYPPELVAQYPSTERDASRMMVVDRKTGRFHHQKFKSFIEYFSSGDVLVLNNSRVFPCRLIAQRPTGGRVECFLVREVEKDVWECLLSPSKKVQKGEKFVFSDTLSGEVVDDFNMDRNPPQGGISLHDEFAKQVEPSNTLDTRKVRLHHQGSLFDILKQIGHVPLPPYIDRQDERNFDVERYQNIYAGPVGSVAAPTAGFHFTPQILEQLKAQGVHVVYVTLHVGLGTFFSIRTENLAAHQMHGEHYEIPQETATVIEQARKAGKSISVVGTTAVRALESASDAGGNLQAGRGYTEKFIYPPHRFRMVDRLLTNFHQPRSTLLALVYTFAGKDFIRKAYQEAIGEKYRLFSYGDCMWIV